MVTRPQGPSRRVRQVEDLVRGVLSELLLRGLKDPRVAAGLVTVTGAQVSPDLRHAKVWVSVIGDGQTRRRALEGLDAGAGFLRRELGARLQTKRTPALRFELDRTAERAALLEEALGSLPPPGLDPDPPSDPPPDPDDPSPE